MNDRDPADDGDGLEPKRRLFSRAPRLPKPAELTRKARVGAKQVVRRQVPGGARHSFRVDMAAMFLAGLYTGAVFPFVNVIARDDLKADAHVLAFITAAPFLGNLLALFWARAVEGRRKVPFVVGSHFAARSVILLAAFASGAWQFALVISAAQIIGTVATPAYAAVIKDVYPDSQRGRILSYSRAAILVAQVFATLGVGWLMSGALHLTYRVIFPLGALLGLAAAFVFARINPNEEPSGEEGSASGPLGKVADTARYIWSTLGILKEDVAYRWFALSVFTYGFGNLLTVPIIPLIQVDELHIQKSELAVLFNLMQVVAILSYFYWGRYVDRRSPQRAVVLNILINTIVPLVYVASGFIPYKSAWVLLPAYVVSGVVMAGIDMSYFNAILTFAGAENVSRYQALQSFLLGIRGSVAPFIGSAMAEVLKAHHHDLRWAFAFGMVFMYVGAWMQLMAARRQEALVGFRR
jgi:sugar phosphate permease